VDLSKTLFALGQAGMIFPPPPAPSAPVFVPTPNHSHVVDNSRVNTGPIWWEVRPVLVLNRADWPAPDGSSGITSSSLMDAAEAAGRAIEVGSNFFLFFSSQMGSQSADMEGMPADQHQHMAGVHTAHDEHVSRPAVMQVPNQR